MDEDEHMKCVQGCLVLFESFALCAGQTCFLDSPFWKEIPHFLI